MKQLYTDNPDKLLYLSDRLVTELEKIFRFPLTIVKAPMGYGKTTATNEFLLNSDANILWQNIYDDSLETFWKGFAGLFFQISPDLSASLEKIGVPVDSLSVQEAIELLKRHSLERQTVIVIDDFHLITEKPIVFFFEVLARERISNLHIVLNARFFQFPNFNELILKRNIHLISQDHLKLEVEDIENYFSLANIRISRKEACTIHKMTEGWFSAVYLKLLACQKTSKIGSSIDIFNLLKEAIYDNLSDELKKFCLVILPLSPFTMEQASFIWNQNNASVLLNEIVRKNAFITQSKKNNLYQVHNIFKEFLQKNSAEIEPQKVEYLNRAADWFKKTENPFAAMEIYYQLNDYKQLLKTLEGTPNAFPTDNQIIFLDKIFANCPIRLRKEHPIALLKYAWHKVFRGGLNNLAELCDELVNTFKANCTEISEETAYFLGEIEILRSVVKFNDIQKMAIHHKNAKKLLNRNVSLSPDSSGWSFGSPSVLYLYHRKSGELRKNVKLLIDNLHVYSEIANDHGRGGEYIMEAEWYYLQGNFELAEISLQKAINLAKPVKENAILACALMLQLKLALIKGDYESAQQKLQEYRLHIILNKAYLYLHTFEMCENTLYALLDQENKMSEEFILGDPNHYHIGFPALGTLIILQCQYLLLKGKIPELIGRTVHLERIASVFPNIMGIIYAKIFSSAANITLGNEAEAVSALEFAFKLSMPDNILMPFAENLDFLQPAIETLNKKKAYKAFLGRIKKLYKQFSKEKSKIISAHFFESTKPLSSRELQIATPGFQRQNKPPNRRNSFYIGKYR